SEVDGRAWTSIAELRLLCDGVTFRAVGETTPAGLFPPVDAAMTELDRQYVSLKHDLANRARFTRYAPQTFRRESLILPDDRDPADVVLRRTRALLEDISRMAGAPDLSSEAEALEKLRRAGRQVPVSDEAARRKLFDEACRLRRRIALSNPLLNFDEILFVKRHRSSFNHMCDQFYGINAIPGGGLYVLSGAFSDHPVVRNVLADSVVTRGRLAGSRLAGGSFVTPALSWDGRRIAFAYVECEGDKAHHWNTETDKRGYWSRGRCYHIFKVNADGTQLEQLTDGTWNDFAPCWLPNGRIAFISERRGGYLRCGRTCPTYTLFDMAADGTDIRCLSFHETNEWLPSVTHDGMIIYTRWDYVDRHGCTAHMPWITTPDGRDARAVQGNFAPRPLRPDMEIGIRAVPGSEKFIATAAPHHGQMFGSLVMIDPAVEDDNKMAPVRRITPDVAFPESQGGTQAYGTAWPLSENYYLCVYDPLVPLRGARAGRQGRRDSRLFDYGIYLVDAFGNKELIYRDPNIACQSPIPLRPRPMPPVVPAMSRRVDRHEPAEGTMTLINVYDSVLPWPVGTKIKALRIYEVIPMSVPSGSPPHEIGLRVRSAGDSVTLARYVIGTVPVEEDGSASFIVPARKELFFQALDANGLAVQSMRSATYVQPGEHLVCQGCHEPRHHAPRPPLRPSLAERRPPTRPKPDVDGSNPFSYPRLVQPVLDRKCLPCHVKHPGKAPRLDREVIAKGRRKWYASYWSLAPKYGFWNYGNGYVTWPGKFGARASKLYQMLKKGHHDVKLTDEELHRITLWLDSCSIFYGVYEKAGGEAQLRGEIVHPTLE
ncbi:MAG: PD40 domain-containing protein, partial [Planctomycetes bacterium]|nr:PD40 domain-containing protein [Planctomycetota bacterium]